MPARDASSSTSDASSAARQARPLLAEGAQVRVGARMEPPEQRQDLVPDQPSRGVRIRRVDADREAVLDAVRRRLLPRDGEQRAHDAVLATHLDPARRAARDDPVEDGLDLIRRRVPRGAEPEAFGGGVAEVAHRRLGRRRLDADDAGAHHGRAVLGVGVGGRAAHAVVDVDGGDVVAERPERVPEAGRVGTARDEARDAAARLDQLVGADERLDACCQRRRHTT